MGPLMNLRWLPLIAAVAIVPSEAFSDECLGAIEAESTFASLKIPGETRLIAGAIEIVARVEKGKFKCDSESPENNYTRICDSKLTDLSIKVEEEKIFVPQAVYGGMEDTWDISLVKISAASFVLLLNQGDGAGASTACFIVKDKALKRKAIIVYDSVHHEMIFP